MTIVYFIFFIGVTEINSLIRRDEVNWLKGGLVDSRETVFETAFFIYFSKKYNYLNWMLWWESRIFMDWDVPLITYLVFWKTNCYILEILKNLEQVHQVNQIGYS